MREILFRGKVASEVLYGNAKKDGVWVYGFYRDRIGCPTISEFDFKYGNYIDYEIDRKTLGQFTGLTDKNGKKIFEGDIVRVKGKQTEENWQDYNENGEVVFENGAFLVKVGKVFNGKKYFSEVHSRYMTTADWVEREVVGNVFENKELLGENK